MMAEIENGDYIIEVAKQKVIEIFNKFPVICNKVALFEESLVYIKESGKKRVTFASYFKTELDNPERKIAFSITITEK